MKIHIPACRGSAYTGGLDTVSIAGATVDAVFQQLITTYPDLKQHLFTPGGKLRSFVNVYLNDDDIRYLEGKQETAVKDTDELTDHSVADRWRNDSPIALLTTRCVCSKRDPGINEGTATMPTAIEEPPPTSFPTKRSPGYSRATSTFPRLAWRAIRSRRPPKCCASALEVWAPPPRCTWQPQEWAHRPLPTSIRSMPATCNARSIHSTATVGKLKVDPARSPCSRASTHS